MKTKLYRFLWAGTGLLSACFSTSIAQDNPPSPSLSEVQQQVQKRRQMREEVQAASLIGGVFQPMKQDDRERASLEIPNRSVRESAQTYANLTGKEVMVSAKVATKRLSISRQSLSRDEAIKAMGDALREVGVAIVPLVESTVVLIDAADFEKETGKRRQRDKQKTSGLDSYRKRE